MKAISVHQPYGALLVARIKLFETRGWRTSYRGPIAIHVARTTASLTEDLLASCRCEAFLNAVDMRRFDRSPLEAQLGCVIGTAELVDVKPADQVFASLSEQLFGDFGPGRYAWSFRNVVALPVPVPARGALGLWDWDGAPCEA